MIVLIELRRFKEAASAPEARIDRRDVTPGSSDKQNFTWKKKKHENEKLECSSKDKKSPVMKAK